MISSPERNRRAIDRSLKEEGIVFDIQRFSIHDGPGIRTLVFLKGCPLRCLWCCNPESQAFSPELLFDPGKCISCKTCAETCPRGAISVTGERLFFERELCQGCGKCAQVCYSGARMIAGRKMSVEEVLEEILKDTLFYRNSGGGVTLGGGEPLAQPDFAAAMLEASKKKRLHTAIETAGHIPWVHFEKVLPYTDLFLFDVKHMDPEVHRNFTGKDNALILANLERLARKGSVIVRTPVIPGFNDTQDQIGAIARFAHRLGICELHLLPYHRLGEGKYRLLGREPQKMARPKVEEEELDTLKRCAETKGMVIKVGG